MTERIVRAMQHPCFKIWGHALGRLLLSPPAGRVPRRGGPRRASPSRAPRSRSTATRTGWTCEPRWIRAARERGIRFVISTDAHSIGELAQPPLRRGHGPPRLGAPGRGAQHASTPTRSSARWLRGRRDAPVGPGAGRWCARLPALPGPLRRRARAACSSRRARASTSPVASAAARARRSARCSRSSAASTSAASSPTRGRSRGRPPDVAGVLRDHAERGPPSRPTSRWTWRASARFAQVDIDAGDPRYREPAGARRRDGSPRRSRRRPRSCCSAASPPASTSSRSPRRSASGCASPPTSSAAAT